MTPTGLTSGVTHPAVGKHSTCAVRAGDLYCWGTSEFPDGTYPEPFDASADDQPYDFMGTNHAPVLVPVCDVGVYPDGGPLGEGTTYDGGTGAYDDGDGDGGGEGTLSGTTDTTRTTISTCAVGPVGASGPNRSGPVPAALGFGLVLGVARRRRRAA